MKKIIFAAVILLLGGTITVAARNYDRAVTFEQLPQKAQAFIKSHFATNKISYAKQDTDLFDGDFEVMFTDGKKVEFNKKGEWKDVECKLSEVPVAIIPQSILSYITQHHPKLKVLTIDRDSRDYELKLANGTEIRFNLKGAFLGYDF